MKTFVGFAICIALVFVFLEKVFLLSFLTLCEKMILTRCYDGDILEKRSSRSRSAQGPSISSPAMKIPLPPRLWITDVSDDSANDSGSVRDEQHIERPRLRSRYRHHKMKSTANVPIGIFWDIENCQVPRGCSAIDVVSAIRDKFLLGRREADFVVVCDVRKESVWRLQELNDAQVSLIHVCGTQKNAADEKLRQCMRRYGELHSAPAALLLISGDINFAADLSDFRHRKNMDVILVHKQNTSTALIACATSHYCYNELTAHLPRNSKVPSQCEDEEATCEMQVTNLPSDQPPERVSRRLRRLADNCGGKVMKVQSNTATLKFPTPDHASRALKRMDGEDVFGNKIGTRYLRNGGLPFNTYSSDEGYSTGSQPNFLRSSLAQVPATPTIGIDVPPPSSNSSCLNTLNSDWALALQQLPVPPPMAEPVLARQFAVAIQQQVKPRKIRGTHGSSNTELSGCSSGNSGDDCRTRKREASVNGAQSPWNSSASFSEQSSEGDVSEPSSELTVTNLPPFDPNTLQEMLTQLFSQYVNVVRASVWTACEGPIGTVTFRTENDARLAIARVHKRRLDNQWMGRRLELSLGKPSPAPNLEVLRARLRAILLEQPKQTLPLLRLRDAYASRHCCALTTSDIVKVRDTVIIHESFGRMVQLIDLSPVSNAEMLEAPWRCHIHAAIGAGQEDGSRILMPVLMEVAVLASNVQLLLEKHEGILPLLSFVECYEAMFPKLIVDTNNGVALELLLRSVPGIVIRDKPSRHISTGTDRGNTPSPASHISEGDRKSVIPRTAPALEPMLALFERELVDLLRTAPRCTIPFSKLIPAFHHHFGRQCRVADYGFTKLPDLLAALSNTVVVLGSGSMRVITLSAAAQSRRWSADLVKILRNQPGRGVHVAEVPQLYQALFSQPLLTVDYGVCSLHELMARVAPQAVLFGQDGSLSLPRRTPTPEEKGRTVQFAIQAIELLCHTPNLRMEFSKFVPDYHAHFGRQLRVAHYGCVKLVELFELIPESMRVCAGVGGEREVRLALRPARIVLGQRMKLLSNIPVANFANAYAAQFGASPLPDMLDVSSVESLVYAAGGAVEDGLVKAPGEAPRSVTICLSAVAALSADRSVRGSTDDYFTAAFREIFGQYPDIQLLCEAQVIARINRRVVLHPYWRAVWRLAQVLAAKQQPLTWQEIVAEYMKRFEPTFPCKDLGFDSVLSFVRNFPEVFKEDGLQRFSVCAGVVVPQGCEYAQASEDFSIYDTPPGQKGSRVFESPMTNIWYSPPASALPVPSELLVQDKRRTRLAAQFTDF